MDELRLTILELMHRNQYCTILLKSIEPHRSSAQFRISFYWKPIVLLQCKKVPIFAGILKQVQDDGTSKQVAEALEARLRFGSSSF